MASKTQSSKNKSLKDTPVVQEISPVLKGKQRILTAEGAKRMLLKERSKEVLKRKNK